MTEKIKKFWWVIIIALLIAGAFYWYEYRPTQIRKKCMENAQQGISGIKKLGFDMQGLKAKLGSQEEIDRIYLNCLREHGLVK